MEIESCLYHGQVKHERVLPTQHSFQYTLYFFWLKLDELNVLDQHIKHFSVNRSALYQFRTKDYLIDNTPKDAASLQQAVKHKMQSLGAQELNGDIFFLGQIRAMGIFFSPVNFYFHRPKSEKRFDWMLAEVSNTPWNQRHYYLVDLSKQHNTDKQFHVSPFNPMDMQYQWQIAQPNEQLNLALSCIKHERHFTASMAMQRQAFNNKTMGRLLMRMPSTTLFTLIGIYWQALRLFLKRTPIYGHPGTTNQSIKENNHVAK